jgi:hypothetical protein
MEIERLKSSFKDTAEEEVPSADVALWPGIKSRLVGNKIPALNNGEIRHLPIHSPHRFPAAAVLTLLVVVGMTAFLVHPHRRALAQQIFNRFFAPTGQTSFPVPPVDLTAQALPDSQKPTEAPTPIPASPQVCPQADPRQFYVCSLAFAQTELGFPLKALPTEIVDIPGMAYDSMKLDSQKGSVELQYGDVLFLSQGQGEFSHEFLDFSLSGDAVPGDAVQPVLVDGQLGEYVQGGFLWKPGSDQYIWDPEGSATRLRWREGDTWFQLFKPGTPEALRGLLGDRDAFIHLAEKLVAADAIMGNGNDK